MDLLLLRLGGESSTSIQSDGVVRPCSLDNRLGGGSLRLLLARLGVPNVLADSSAGLETINFGGTGDDAPSAVSGYENTGHALAS